MKLIIYIVFLLFSLPSSNAQISLVQIPDTSNQAPKVKNNPQKSINITAPAALIGYGAFTIVNKDLHQFNLLLRHELVELNTDQKKRNYDFLQYVPVETVYGLNALGIKGKHNFVDRTLIYALSNFIMSTSVSTIKRVSHQPRPDGSDYRSFPSGHTATAFSAAEFMRLEYKDKSPWYGVAAYTIAGTAGALRMYDNKHWFSDIVAGAGIGILSTDLAYWGYPKLRSLIVKKTGRKTGQFEDSRITFIPSIQENTLIFSLIYRPK